MTTIIRPGQRHVMIPGYGVEVRAGRNTLHAGGAAGFVIDYDGSASYLDAGSGASIDNLMNGAMTVETWVWADSGGGYGQGCIASKGSYTNGFWLGYANYSGTPFAFEAKSGDTYALFSALSTFTTGGWHHVAGTYDNAGDKVLRLWIDGSLAGSSATATGTWQNDAANSLHIGKETGGAQRYWDGRIGWFRLSNSVRYTGTFSPPDRCAAPASDSNTALLYTLSEGSGNPQDSSGNANHGTLTSGTWQACS